MKQLKFLSKKLADFQAKIILSVVFIIFVPFFFLMVKQTEDKKWQKWQNSSDILDDLRRQF